MTTQPMIGIDLGGAKIEIITLADDGSILLQRRVPTPQNQYRRTLETIARLVREAETSLGREATVGIGLPGSLSPFDGKMRNANSVCLNGQPLREDIESLLDRRVSITNDANCFALSEATDGAATGAGSVFGVIVGAGTGAGLVVESKVLDGCNGVAGEWGHNPLPWPRPDELPGPACWCGQRGRLETWLSGPGLARDHEEQTGAKGLTARAIAEAEARGDPAATETLERYETCLARGLSHIINIFDPEVIVLGGGISNIQRLYIPLAPKNTPFRARRFLSRARRKNAGIVALRQVFTTQLSTKRCVA